MDIENYTPSDLKKLFTKGTNINFLNDYTFQDVEDGKKRLYLQMSNTYPKEKLQNFLDKAGRKLMEDKVSNGFDKPIGAIIKNTVKDNLNPDYKNTIKRLINIDSQYVPLNVKNPYDYVYKLSEKLVNVVSLELINIQIPVTMYNIETAQGNNYFIVDASLVEISDGNYSLSSLVDAINTAMTSKHISMDLSINSITGKAIFTNNTTSSHVIDFYDDSMEGTKINFCLGWILGFRNYTVDASDNPFLSYTMASTLHSTLTSENVAYIPNTKNITVVVNEFSQNHTAGTIVETINDIHTIKPSFYTYNSKTPKSASYTPVNLECITPTSIATTANMITAQTNTGLTKAQLYTRAQINQNKLLVNHQSNYLEPNTQNGVLAILPFEYDKYYWGTKYFTDKNDYLREYHGPIEIEKIQIKMYDDRGFEINFNGIPWSVTLITEHLYKY
jgi:hypothetical protein